MKRLGSEKRKQLGLVVAVTAIALTVLWFGLIRSQMQTLERLSKQKEDAKKKYEQVMQVIKAEPQVAAQLAQIGQSLSEVETGMASGDLYSWVINAVRQFKLPYKVEIPQFSQIDGPKDMNLLPQFPYKQATLTIAGTAQFYDFGRFLADFENQFPYIRVLNVTLEPLSSPNPADREKLNFKMDIVTLVKPTTT